MRREHLIDRVAKDCGLAYDVARDVVTSFCDTVAQQMCEGESVPLPGIGTLRLRGRNVENGLHLHVSFGVDPCLGRRLRELAAQDTPKVHAAVARILGVEPEVLMARAADRRLELAGARKGRRGGRG